MLKTILANLLRQTANDLESGKFKCEDSEIIASIDTLSNFKSEFPLSKAQACQYLNISRSTFDTYIRNGWIPKGVKRLGFKELSWTKEQLDVACDTIKEITNKINKN